MAKADKYSRLRDAGKLTGTLKDCRAKRKERDERQSKPEKKNPLTVIEFGSTTQRWLSSTVMDRPEHVRKQNWDTPQPCRDLNAKKPFCHTRNHGKYSASCKYDRFTYCPMVRSCGRVTPKRLLWFFADQSGFVMAKRGWKFGKDQHGLYVVRISEKRTNFRYHFSRDDIATGGIFREAKLHEAGQKVVAEKLALQEKISAQRIVLEAKAKEIGVYVTFQDSRRSGNCGAGTATFCREHGLDVRSCYPLEVVQRFATNGHSFQVQRAIRAAVDRSVEDITRGFCLIGER